MNYSAYDLYLCHCPQLARLVAEEAVVGQTDHVERCDTHRFKVTESHENPGKPVFGLRISKAARGATVATGSRGASASRMATSGTR